MVTKVGEAFLKRLYGHIRGLYMRKYFWHLNVDSDEYADAIKEIDEKSEHIIRCYHRGLFTEEEAANSLISLAYENKE